MHCLKGVSLGKTPERESDSGLWEIKIEICRTKARKLLFKSEDSWIACFEALKKASGFKDILDQYYIGEEVLGQGKYGTVKLGYLKKTKDNKRLKVAIKCVNKY